MPALEFVISSLAVALAIGPATGAVPTQEAPTPSAPEGRCGTAGAPPCYSRVFAWGIDCEGDSACEASRAEANRDVCANLTSLIAGLPVGQPSAGTAAEPRGVTDGWIGLALAGLAGVGIGSAVTVRAIRRRPEERRSDELIELSVEPPRWPSSA
jgi:hypothetical protein